MKKVLIASDGSSFSKGAFEFARRLNELQPVLLTGIFLPQTDIENFWSISTGLEIPTYVPIMTAENKIRTQELVEQFKKDCIKHGMEFRVHETEGRFVASDIEKESRYADLLIIGSECFYDSPVLMAGNEYLERAARAAECPVVVVPEHFTFPEGLIIGYDGSSSSVYAMKQFAYLFPELTSLPTMVVYSSNSNNDIPNLSYIEELASRHFPNLNFFKLEVDARIYFSTWMADKQNTILITGAFGRSALSEAIRKSFVSEIISEGRLPLFIAHR